MADKKHILTYAGLKKYEDELQDLKVNRRREIAQKIKEAREQGDLSENAEYDAAKLILLPVKSVGVMGDERTYERAVALRAVTSTDAMTADWAHLPYDFMAKVSNDIINKVKGVNRVCYDISSKPPSTIEWE